MIDKGCLYHVVRVKDLECEIPSIKLVPIEREYHEFVLVMFQGILGMGN